MGDLQSIRLIDDLTIFIDSSDDLRVTFAQVDGNKFYENDKIKGVVSYINRDILLPGEKYILFIEKNN